MYLRPSCGSPYLAQKLLLVIHQAHDSMVHHFQVDLFEAHSFNMALAKDYKRLQYEFIAAKSLALQVVEKKLEKEESLRDQRQVRSLCISPAMS